jgi:hypothetical protein
MVTKQENRKQKRTPHKKSEIFLPKVFSGFYFWTFLKMSNFENPKKLLEKIFQKWVESIML